MKMVKPSTHNFAFLTLCCPVIPYLGASFRKGRGGSDCIYIFLYQIDENRVWQLARRDCQVRACVDILP